LAKNTGTNKNITKVTGYKVDKEELRKAIKNKVGLVSFIAQALNVERNTIYKSIKKYGLEQEMEDARDTTIDLAESNIFSAMKSGDINVSMFYLKTIGKHRGYVEKTEVDQTGKITLVLDNEYVRSTDKKKLSDGSDSSSSIAN
jgi:hypothetical protein